MSVALEISVEREYEKNPDIKPSDIYSLRLWINQQPHLPSEHISDQEIILAYHSCSCSLERTKEVIDLNYTLKSLVHFYKNRTVDRNIETALKTWLITPVKATTASGYRPIYCQLQDDDPNNFIYVDVVRAFVMILDLWLYEEGTTPGICIILNMDRVTWTHIARMDLKVAHQFFYFLQEAMFVRLKEFHFMNAPRFIDSFLKMLTPLMTDKMLDLIKVHPVNSNSINDSIPLDILPRDAGGTNKDSSVLSCEVWKRLQENESFFEKESKKRVDESKRPGEQKSMSTFFNSFEGTFERLEID